MIGERAVGLTEQGDNLGAQTLHVSTAMTLATPLPQSTTAFTVRGSGPLRCTIASRYRGSTEPSSLRPPPDRPAYVPLR